MPATRISEHRVTGEFTVIAFSIIGTSTVVLEALEKGDGIRTHSSFTRPEGVAESLGYVVSRHLPADIDAIPYGEGRTVAVGAHHRQLDKLAEGTIRAAYPDLPIRFSGGHGTCTLDAFTAVPS